MSAEDFIGLPPSFSEGFPGTDADAVLRNITPSEVNSPESFDILPGDREYAHFDTLYPEPEEGDSSIDATGPRLKPDSPVELLMKRNGLSLGEAAETFADE